MTTQLPAGMDQERYDSMLKDIDHILTLNEQGKMAEALTEERGGLYYHCKNHDCTQQNGPYTLDFDPETDYKSPTCPSCGGKEVSLGTRAGIIDHYHAKC